MLEGKEEPFPRPDLRVEKHAGRDYEQVLLVLHADSDPGDGYAKSRSEPVHETARLDNAKERSCYSRKLFHLTSGTIL